MFYIWFIKTLSSSVDIQYLRGVTNLICTYLNAFLTVIPNIVTRFHDFDIFDNFVKYLNCCLLMPN